MTPLRLLITAIIPALTELEDSGIQDTPSARRMLVAIALQESGLANRRQVVSGGAENGPAASFWQFEQGGGCKGVLGHHASAKRMLKVCNEYNVMATPAGLWEAMRYQDIVAACAARLLLYTLPGALPTTAEEGWKQYISVWRPGKPHPQKWQANWDAAERLIKEFA